MTFEALPWGDDMRRSRSCAEFNSNARMRVLSYRRQSAPSSVISKALTRSRTLSRENCLSPVSPETCLLVQSFLTPSRVFVSHTYAQLKTGLQTQERHLFLLSDILLIAKAKSSTHFKLKAQARVCEMWTASCVELVSETSTSPQKSFVMGWPTCNCVATFSSMEQKEKWLSLIKSRIKAEKDKDDPKTIPLKVLAKDIGSCAYTKTLAVSNSDCVTEVIRLALQQFGIVGCVKDYQLWVSSRKDNAPYPLIGHEFPFSIRMSHTREPLAPNGIKDAVIPPDRQGELLIEQLQIDAQCQFILKPSRVVVGHSLMESGQKPFKRRRSLISWAFWRGSTSQLDGPLSPPTHPSAGRLFGLPLSAVCKDDALPKPIMDMLVFLYQEGPFTRGIFRRSAGAKACRDLRDRLDTGAQVFQPDHDSIFVVAAVFKDFLRNIPGSLLSSELYEQWMRAMDTPAEREHSQLEDVQRLVGRLPSENALLLRHVLAVLHCIQERSHDNQMNAFNLAVCIAPSMLYAPAPSSPEVEGEGAKKVCDLVRLMIEQCRGVVGEDGTWLLSGFPQRSSSSDHGSDVSFYQMTDSSYDSLENELDDLASPFLAPPLGSRSRDSVITLSDCDLDQPDIDPDGPLLAPLAYPTKAAPAARPPCPQPRSPCEAPVYPQGVRRMRRCSEPTIRNSTSSLAKCLEHHPDRKGSYDGVTDRDRDDEAEQMFAEHLSTLQLGEQTGPSERGRWGLRGISRRKKKQPEPPPLHLDASCSSLYSPGASPTRSSASSLDSAFSQHSADYATVPAVNRGASGNASPCSLGQASPRSPGPTVPSPKSSSPKEVFDWRRVRSSSHGLHPNTWLKRDRRLSLRQPDKEGLEGEDATAGSSDKPLQSDLLPKLGQSRGRGAQEPGEPTRRRRSSSPVSYQQALLQTQHCESLCYTASVKPLTVKELRELHYQACSMHKTTTGRRYSQRGAAPGSNHSPLPQAVFYGQSARCLALYRQKSHSLIQSAEETLGHPISPRRASEPGSACLGLDSESTMNLERLHRQALDEGDRDLPRSHGLLVSDVEPQGEGAEPRFCLSPAATKAVRDYFAWHARQDPLRKSREVTLAIMQGKREWQRRCSDPRLDDFEKMLFAEESYV